MTHNKSRPLAAPPTDFVSFFFFLSVLSFCRCPSEQVDRASARKRRGDDKEEDDTEEEGQRRSTLLLAGPRPLPVGGPENLRQDNPSDVGGWLTGRRARRRLSNGPALMSLPPLGAAKEGESSKCGASLLPAKSPRRQSCRLTQSNNALVDKIFALQTQVRNPPPLFSFSWLSFVFLFGCLTLHIFFCRQASSMERKIQEETQRATIAEDQLAAAEARLRHLEDQRNAKTKAQEVEVIVVA